MKTERDFLDAKHEFSKKYADFVFSLQNEHNGQAERVIGELNKSKIWLEHFFVSAWFASDQREGYKLVPVEPTMNICNQLSSNVENAKLIYKALIEAA